MAKREVSTGEEFMAFLGVIACGFLLAALLAGLCLTIYQIWHTSAQVDALVARPISGAYFNAPNSNDNAPTFCELHNGNCKN